ncbi:MAG: hypothetical protein ACYDBR_10480 [Gaiellaceae bacterium]
MKALRRHRAAAGALACIGIAVVLALLAADARAWQATVTRDDIRFRALPSHGFLWRPPTVLPGDPAGRLIGTHSTLAYRRALQLFWFSRLGVDPETRADLPTIRAVTEQDLQDLVFSAPRASERSAAANLLGVLIVATPPPGSDRTGLVSILKRGAGYFQQAIALDSSNYDAKQNLELVYRLLAPGHGRFGHDARAGYGFGRGHGSATLGSGY